MMTQFNNFMGGLGRNVRSSMAETARLSLLVKESAYWLFLAPLGGHRGLRRDAFARQLTFVGNESVFIICLVGASVGAVLALQAAYQLKEFGAILYTGALVSVSMTRELGPVMAAIVLAGRVGASVTAELGTMKVQEEVDALMTMGIPPIPYLVVPRILAMLIMLPCLTVLANAVGIMGGWMVGAFGLDIPSELYLQAGFDALVHKDIWTGLAKSGVFALLVGLISTYQGLTVKGGAEGVGKSTTQSVVYSVIAIIVADCVCTALFFYVLS